MALLDVASAGATVAGQSNDVDDAEHAVISGGGSNTVSECTGATVAGGESNYVDSDLAVVAGGVESFASGTGSFVAGGGSNTAAGAWSFAAGCSADAVDDRSAVFRLLPIALRRQLAEMDCPSQGNGTINFCVPGGFYVNGIEIGSVGNDACCAMDRFVNTTDLPSTHVVSVDDVLGIQAAVAARAQTLAGLRASQDSLQTLIASQTIAIANQASAIAAAEDNTANVTAEVALGQTALDESATTVSSQAQALADLQNLHAAQQATIDTLRSAAAQRAATARKLAQDLASIFGQIDKLSDAR